MIGVSFDLEVRNQSHAYVLTLHPVSDGRINLFLSDLSTKEINVLHFFGYSKELLTAVKEAVHWTVPDDEALKGIVSGEWQRRKDGQERQGIPPALLEQFLAVTREENKVVRDSELFPILLFFRDKKGRTIEGAMNPDTKVIAIENQLYCYAEEIILP
ncbi:MAG: hypothetical protein LBQ15_07965 [Clostridium sp.]|nr:hypothetical protein [Clostridium sp.]